MLSLATTPNPRADDGGGLDGDHASWGKPSSRLPPENLKSREPGFWGLAAAWAGGLIRAIEDVELVLGGFRERLHRVGPSPHAQRSSSRRCFGFSVGIGPGHRVPAKRGVGARRAGVLEDDRKAEAGFLVLDLLRLAGGNCRPRVSRCGVFPARIRRVALSRYASLSKACLGITDRSSSRLVWSCAIRWN